MAAILTVVGARPNFIKCAVVSKALQEAGISEHVVHTGQHTDPCMAADLFSQLEIYPYPLIVTPGSNPASRLGHMITAIGCYINAAETPYQYVMVYGDTDSTLAGALAAVKCGIPVIHVEAGLRSYAPMQEEYNRTMIDQVADVLFCPTHASLKHLQDNHIHGAIYTGDVMYDAVRLYTQKAGGIAELQKIDLRIEGRTYALATMHRAENVDDPDALRILLQGLADLATKMPVVMPVHPRTEKMIAQLGLKDYFDAIITLPPVSYFDMLLLERYARVIVTDSGGVQKEAYFNRVPSVTLRAETEWLQLVESGWTKLCPPWHTESIVATVEHQLNRTDLKEISDFGEGYAAVKIAEHIKKLLVKG